MRIPSGKTDQSIYFFAADSTDLVTAVTGLSAFTVYRSRNGSAATAYTTPTLSELSATNMPGLYRLLIDEDTTIASTSDSEEYAVTITATGMAPVHRVIELYRRDTTSGQTLTVASGVGSANATQIGGQTASASGTVTFPNATLASTTNITAGTITTATNVTTVNGLAANVITAASIATGAIDADAIADNAIDAGAIASGAITSAKFAAGAITSTVIAADAIGASQIATDAIGSAELAASAVTKIQTGLPTASDNATAVFAHAFPASAGSLTFEELTSLIAYANLAKVSGMDANAPVFRNIADSGNTITATTDASGNRLSVVLTP